MPVSDKAIKRPCETDIRKVDKNTLVNAQDMNLDKDIPLKDRAAYIAAYLQNPYCFLVGDIVVKVEFSDPTHSLQDNLTDYFVRKKNGV